MKWFVGLGNPGRKYARTRHNIGFMAVDHFADKWNLDWKKGPGPMEVAMGRIQNEQVALIKPMTYMNLSGEAVRAFYDYYKCDIDDLIVLYDDLDTEFGRLRLRYKGSSGGHNGIKSLISHLGTESFKRVRIGISRPENGEDVISYVLSDFPKRDREVLANVIDVASDVMEDALELSFDRLMAKYNTRETIT